MKKKTMIVSTVLYGIAALLGAANFFLNWQKDGMIEASTGLLGMSAALFAVAAVCGVVRLLRQPKDTKEEK